MKSKILENMKYMTGNKCRIITIIFSVITIDFYHL
jgi:hypothetical protein